MTILRELGLKASPNIASTPMARRTHGTDPEARHREAPLYLLDTDIFTHFLRQHPLVIQHLLRCLTDDVAISVITVEEVMVGWYSALRQARKPDQVVAAYERLAETVRELAQWEIIGLSVRAMARYQQLKALRLNVGKQDLRIGAIALEWGASVVTANLVDFRRIPNLTCENWSV
jgi:tRNA(fMet)-specific endonuclease VapC